MITTAQLIEALERQFEGTHHFLVFAEVRSSGKAVVEVDNDDAAITLLDLTTINQDLRDTFGEALDDVELEVSSPGMGRPFKVERQFRKHTGRTVETVLKDGRSLKGQLVSYGPESLVLRIEHPSKIKGRPAKLDDEPTAIPVADIKSTQASINFN